MKKINRRNFLRVSATAGAGAIILPSTALSAVHQTNETEKMPVRRLGKTGIELPVLSMGVMRADNPNLLRAAYRSGIVHFDTAHGYQNGKNETLVGQFLQDKPRESFVVATKGKAKYPYEDNFEEEYTALLETSLKRLQMEYVDIFYMHAVDKPEEITDKRVINLLKKFKSEGKICHIGFSTHANKPGLIDAAIEAGIYEVILLSYNFKLKNLKETEEAIERGVKAGIGFVAMKTMTGGSEDAAGKKKINAQACLKWVWQNKNITTIIPGFTNYDELDECLAAVQQRIFTDDEKAYLAVLSKEELLYCQHCDRCLEQCPEQLPIPDIMRAYMYTYGYKYPALSKETLAGLNLPDSFCSCPVCSVECPSNFNVAQKIHAITPILKVSDEFLA